MKFSQIQEAKTLTRQLKRHFPDEVQSSPFVKMLNTYFNKYNPDDEENYYFYRGYGWSHQYKPPRKSTRHMIEPHSTDVSHHDLHASQYKINPNFIRNMRGELIRMLSAIKAQYPRTRWKTINVEDLVDVILDTIKFRHDTDARPGNRPEDDLRIKIRSDATQAFSDTWERSTAKKYGKMVDAEIKDFFNQNKDQIEDVEPLEVQEYKIIGYIIKPEYYAKYKSLTGFGGYTWRNLEHVQLKYDESGKIVGVAVNNSGFSDPKPYVNTSAKNMNTKFKIFRQIQAQ